MRIPLIGLRAAAIVAAILATAALTACRADEPVSTSSGSPTLSAPATASVEADPIRAAADSALAAYRGMWAAYEKAAQEANPDEPSMQTYATGTALTALTTGVKSIKDRGLVLKGKFVLNPSVTGFEPADVPTKVTVKDCADDSNALLYRQTGELYNDVPGGRRSALATVENIGGGTWKVTSFGVKEVGSC